MDCIAKKPEKIIREKDTKKFWQIVLVPVFGAIGYAVGAALDQVGESIDDYVVH